MCIILAYAYIKDSEEASTTTQSEIEDSVTPTNERTPKNLSLSALNTLGALSNETKALATSKDSEFSSTKSEEYFTAQSNFTSLSEISSSSK